LSAAPVKGALGERKFINDDCDDEVVRRARSER
jgi:hypothetical protein